MGIPSYFSYIIKNHSNIIRNLNYHQNINKTSFQHLYIDANSIIYDAYRLLEKETENLNQLDKTEIEKRIIEQVIVNLKKYIVFIKPTTTIFIGFDGVAPFAKMEQQRTRRYKSDFMTTVSFNKNTSQPPKSTWNTTAITPGTNFMNTLSQTIIYEFMHKEGLYGVSQIIVTPSIDPGEGEHKLYQHVRNHISITDTVAVYGLDSDLIMLSIFHLKYCKNIYIFREAPEFANSIIKIDNTSVKLPLFLNIDLLVKSITNEMDCKCPDPHRANDYVFLCFFLGNDFLPHFPALNIRTNGIQILLDTYRMFIGNKPDRFLISKSQQIEWRNVRILLEEIAKNEKDYITTEYSLRDKLEYKKYEQTSEKERENYFNSVPVIFRVDEKYISPNELNWEDRYYKILLHETREKNAIKTICNNYLEGLEWVFKYYTAGCPHWKWKYNYHYPPLLVDLVAYVPHYDTEFIQKNDSKPFSPYTQLSYVLPKSQFELLPKQISKYLLDKFPHLYSTHLEFQWAFCRYFWECHIRNTPIPLTILENWDKNFINV